MAAFYMVNLLLNQLVKQSDMYPSHLPFFSSLHAMQF